MSITIKKHNNLRHKTINNKIKFNLKEIKNT